MPYKSSAQRAFMHIHLPSIAKKWDQKYGGKVNKVYKTGTPVAHKNMKLDPTGYINREANKASRIQPSTQRSGLAKMAIERAAQRRLAVKKKQASHAPVRRA